MYNFFQAKQWNMGDDGVNYAYFSFVSLSSCSFKGLDTLLFCVLEQKSSLGIEEVLKNITKSASFKKNAVSFFISKGNEKIKQIEILKRKTWPFKYTTFTASFSQRGKKLNAFFVCENR